MAIARPSPLPYVWLREGPALIFELREQNSGSVFVKAYFTVQTLDQMRNSVPLSLATPPERVAVALPGCGKAVAGCSWKSLQSIVEQAVKPEFVR